MGKVFFEDPIHHISGKIAKKFRTEWERNDSPLLYQVRQQKIHKKRQFVLFA